jgi:hypothetical protein
MPKIRRDNPHFRPDGPVPNDYASIVARLAVLVPLAGRFRSPQRDIPILSWQVASAWRARLHDLHDHGLFAHLHRSERGRARDDVCLGDQASARFLAMQFCRTPFFVPEAGGRFCRTPTLCPHCWACAAGRMWQSLDTKLFMVEHRPASVRFASSHLVMPQSRGLGWGDLMDDDEGGDAPAPPPAPASARLEGTAMLAVRFPLELRREVLVAPDGLVCGLSEFLHRRTQTVRAKALPRGIVRGRAVDHAHLRAHNCEGGIETVSLGIGLDSADGSEFRWTPTIRQLLFCREEDADEVAAEAVGVMPPHVAAAARVRRFAAPSRREVATALGGLLQYDTMLLRGPVQPALDALRARGGLRLTTTFGYLYGGRK